MLNFKKKETMSRKTNNHILNATEFNLAVSPAMFLRRDVPLFQNRPTIESPKFKMTKAASRTAMRTLLV